MSVDLESTRPIQTFICGLVPGKGTMLVTK